MRDASEESSGHYRTVARLSEIPHDGGKLVLIDATPIGLFRLPGSAEIVALDNRCSHEGAPLTRGWLDGDCVVCPLHLWRFRLADGVCREPVGGRFDVPTFPVRIVGEEVQVAWE